MIPVGRDLILNLKESSSVSSFLALPFSERKAEGRLCHSRKGVVVMQKYIRFIIFAILIAIAFTLKVK